jgi:tetratricopeptide (TPR) repeat protein
MIEENNITQEQFERMEAYLLNELSEVDRRNFEQELAENANLQRELKVQKELMQAVELGALKETLAKIQSQTQVNQNTLGQSRWWIGIAASFLAILAVGMWLINKPDKHEKLFAAHVQYEPGLPVPMSANRASNENYQYHFSDAMVDFKNEQYQKAIQKWSELFEVKPNNDTLNYFIGSAHFNDKQYDIAVNYFLEVSKIETSEFHSKSDFYLVLCWLQTGDLKAINNLVVDANSPYSSKIEAIRNELKQAE